jgi:ribosomal protein S18 acetylase RimI-like enzyme
MVGFVENFLRSQQFSRLTLNVAKNNHDAIRLYRRLGFQIVAEEPGFWSYPDDTGTWQSVHEPSWRMEKSIRR